MLWNKIFMCTAQPKIKSQSQIFRYGRSIFCLSHRHKFSDFFDLCLHWVSIVHGWRHVMGVWSEKLGICVWFSFPCVIPCVVQLKTKLKLILLAESKNIFKKISQRILWSPGNYFWLSEHYFLIYRKECQCNEVLPPIRENE